MGYGICRKKTRRRNSSLLVDSRTFSSWFGGNLLFCLLGIAASRQSAFSGGWNPADGALRRAIEEGWCLLLSVTQFVFFFAGRTLSASFVTPRSLSFDFSDSGLGDCSEFVLSLGGISFGSSSRPNLSGLRLGNVVVRGWIFRNVSPAVASSAGVSSGLPTGEITVSSSDVDLVSIDVRGGSYQIEGG